MQGQDALMEPIGWNGDDDPENPFNWPAARINIYAGLLSLLTLLTPLASCEHRDAPRLIACCSSGYSNFNPFCCSHRGTGRADNNGGVWEH